MSCLGVYFALTEQESQQLLQAGDDDAVMEVVQSLENRWDRDWLVQTDKAWDAIHRCLGEGSLQCKGKAILEKVVLGGKQLYKGNDYIISYLSAKDVYDVSEIIKDITKEWFSKKYFKFGRRILIFRTSDYAGPVNQEDFEYSWDHFIEVRELFIKAASVGRAMVFTVDQ